MKPFSQMIVAALVSLMIPAMTWAQCPDQLLWTNGSSLWAYRAVECSGEFCRKATDKVLFYSSEVKEVGCTKDGEDCKCRAGEAKPIAAAAAIEPDLPIQNRGCQTLDSFVVNIGEAYVQCVEFRYVPNFSTVDDYGQPVARNMRLCVKLSGKPEKGMSNLLVDDDKSKMEGNAIVRTFGDFTVSYPLMASGEQTLEELITRAAPQPQAVTTPDDEKPGPDDDGSMTKDGSETKDGGSATKEAGSMTKKDGSATKDGGSMTKEGSAPKGSAPKQ